MNIEKENFKETAKGIDKNLNFKSELEKKLGKEQFRIEKLSFGRVL